jgi:hypothetical protein
MVNKTRSELTAKGLTRLAERVASITSPSELDPNDVAVSGSIVAEQANDVPDCAVSDKYIVDDGYNLSSDADNSCGFSEESNDLVSTDPVLGPLTDNGGPTLTRKPADKSSPVIDAIPAGSAGCVADATDQRDVSRPQGANCDIGAVEVDQTPIVIHPPRLPHGTVGEAYSVTITATGGLGAPYEISLVAGDLPPGLTFGDGAVISGTPTEAGRFPITVSVDDPVEKDYVIVIEDAAVAPTSTSAPSSSAVPPISNTGANTKPLTVWGVTGILLGALLLFVAAWAGRERYRRAH